MRKRISCKVIRTIPLSHNIDEFHHRSRSNVKSHNINNTRRTAKTNTRIWETSANPRVKDFDKSVVYTNRMNITRIPIDNGHTSPKLNCYI
jgi:hypothetical protein